ncbi:amino acid transporter [Microbacterium sp. QXD-8]|uniref:Amino acid transporter n=1 Tax=Microbacterium psychrotolerans TaxID=3068321 RepID=A0ABU0YVL0_9MICO|nr:amino acid transporter [Microbacterium sp. QXD-8]MDQ7876370.1 amino acid transporter [Microbacterium sp. QXD-8]
MEGSQVVDLFRAFAAAGLRVWLAGGWAVDAIVGRQTRAHDDMDVAVDIRDLPSFLELLGERGFVITTDWAPSRLELTAPDGRVVDVHPVAFAEDGSGQQAGLGGDTFVYASDGFAVGTIDGSVIPCLSVSQQLRFRNGYELRAADIHDLELLEKYR